MKRKYIKPTSVELQLSSEGFMCMSFGGEGDGRLNQTSKTLRTTLVGIHLVMKNQQTKLRKLL